MSGMKIFKGEFAQTLELLLAPGIKAGFPSPAGDCFRESLDFNRDLIRHPEATFYGRVDGDSMEEAGINDGDIAVIGGSIGAWLGMRVWHQKTMHKKFQFGIPLIIVAEIVLIIWIISR